MLSIGELGEVVSQARAAKGLTQLNLATSSRLSRATIDALENGRASDIGVSRLTRILNVLGLELSIRPANNQRPTLDELLAEDDDD